MKRHILRLALLIVALTTILTSCGNKTPKDRTQYLPNITGNAGEVLIVINNCPTSPAMPERCLS